MELHNRTELAWFISPVGLQYKSVKMRRRLQEVMNSLCLQSAVEVDSYFDNFEYVHVTSNSTSLGIYFDRPKTSGHYLRFTTFLYAYQVYGYEKSISSQY